MSKVSTNPDLAKIREAVIAHLSELCGNEQLHFPVPVWVRIERMDPPILRIFGAQTDGDVLYVSNGEGWWQMEPTDREYRAVLLALHTRIRHMYDQASAKKEEVL